MRTYREIQEQYGLSDWELVDIYNQHYGTRRGKLRDADAAALLVALKVCYGDR